MKAYAEFLRAIVYPKTFSSQALSREERQRQILMHLSAVKKFHMQEQVKYYQKFIPKSGIHWVRLYLPCFH